MNIAIDERTKHRLTGLVVIMAIAIIFVPAMLKKSNKHLEENIHISVQLPEKPTLPNVNVAAEEEVFHTVKVAKVALPKPIEAVPASKIARIDNLTEKTNAIKKEVAKSVATTVATSATSASTQSNKAYSVQLAVFNQQKNAKKLVADLRKKGYKAEYQTLSTNDGKPLYKVTVGKLQDRAEAKLLKNELIESTSLKGFIVKHDMG